MKVEDIKTNNLLPAIKVYKIDYEFIINNYTDPKLWDKEWNLFIYKNFVFTLSLNSINVKNKQILFDVSFNSHLDFWNDSTTDTIKYDIGNMNIELLKGLIEKKILYLILLIEGRMIENNDEEYKNVENLVWEERDFLKEIAENFLDENNVTNKDIRDVYIDYYVNKNEKAWRYREDVKELKKYNYLTELLLIFAEATNNQELKERIINHQSKDISDLLEKIDKLKNNIEEQNEEYIDEMKDELEDI